MTEDGKGRQFKQKRMRLWLAMAALAAVLAAIFLPPFISIARYKSGITHLLAAALGRPVRLSSVELRVLPRPGFVLTDLTVEEDPLYGAEPVLHADTVTASIRLLSLWRGRLEIGTISVDEASLNLARNADGRWNIDELFRTAAAQTGAGEHGAGKGHSVRLPYLEATNSRINIKRGAEKLPFSLLNTDLSLWQDQPGEWRFRLRGQPARTDVSLDLADTGVVRMEGSLRAAPLLHDMPVHLDLDWREAQLGQLARLILGYDPGWRGDLTGELHLDGTADAAQIKTRLRAEGVHRAEFSPAAPMDFNARCAFVYHFTERALEDLACDSPLGDGQIHLAGGIEAGGATQFSLELNKVPVAAGLDALRTVRSGIDPELEARGAISGKIAYSSTAARSAPDDASHPAHGSSAHQAKPGASPEGPLSGSLQIDGLELGGGRLRTPIQVAKLIVAPEDEAPVQHAGPLHSTNTSAGRFPVKSSAGNANPPRNSALSATVSIPSGGATPLTVRARFSESGYQLAVKGQAGVARARDLAYAAGMPGAGALEAIAGDPLAVDLAAKGPWMLKEQLPFSVIATPEPETGPDANGTPDSDRLSGTITLRHANWKAAYLANHVEIAEATLHLTEESARWDPVDFSYGPVKGSASLELPAQCAETRSCIPHFELTFGDLDAASLEAAILGAHEKGTLLSTLLDRLNPAAAPAWPQLEGTVAAGSLTLGPIKMQQATASLRIAETGVEIDSLEANLLGGKMQGSGKLRAAAPGNDKPVYSLEGSFDKLKPAAVGQLLGMHWTGAEFNAGGKIELAGFTGKDLAASAKGTLHFDWRQGKMASEAKNEGIPPGLTKFDRWSGQAEIAGGTMVLGKNEVVEGRRTLIAEGAVTLGDPPKVTLGLNSHESQPKR